MKKNSKLTHVKSPVANVVPIRKGEKLIVSPKDRNDGWENFVTLMGTNGDKRTHSKLRWDMHPPEFYEELYAGGGIPSRIVDLIPEESLRRWIDWTNVDNKQKEALEDRCEQLALRETFLKAWKWGRAYGGGLLHIVTDTSDPASPLQKGETVIGLRDLSRWDVRILTTDVEYDFGSPNFGHPRIYYLNVQMGSQYKGYPIHWSRMIRFDGQLVPRRTFIRNNYWHDSILNRIYNSIRNYETSNDSAAVALQDFNVDVYKLKNVASLIATGKEQIVKDRVAMMAFTKSVINAMILDANDEEYENKGRSLEGVAELLVHQANRLVAETDIPHTKLLGESPDGSNATGNSTSQAWDNFISSEQENYCKPKLKRLISILFPEIPRLGFKFRPLRVMDDKETAELRKITAETDAIYENMGALDPSEITESRFGGEEYSTETKIDKQAREAGLIGPGSANDINNEEGNSNEGDPEDGGPDNGGHEGSGRLLSGNSEESTGKESKGLHAPGSQPPEGKDVEPGPSNGTERNNKKKAAKNSDMTGKGREDAFSASTEPEQEVSETSFEAGKGESEFEPRNTVLEVPGGVPATQNFISQTESLPFRDPKTDPHIKGPGIPNKARTFLPTRGNGVTAQSGYDFEKDAGKEGQSQEITQIEPRRTEDSERIDFIEKRGSDWVVLNHTRQKTLGTYKTKEEAEKRLKQIEYFKHNDLNDESAKKLEELKGILNPTKAATIIVRRGDDFLMGQRRDNGRWTLPGGHIEENESHHQGAIRELKEETGFESKKLKFLGSRIVEPKQGQRVHLNMYEHHQDDGKPSWKNDPDKEISKFQWFNSKEPLPEEVMGNLQHPNNMALDHMGLLK